MTSEEKKNYLLLKAVLFHFHGIDEDERRLLERSAESLHAHLELEWCLEFISRDCFTAFERMRPYLRERMLAHEPEVRLHYLQMVLVSNEEKGYNSELERQALLTVAKDWEVEQQVKVLLAERQAHA